MVAIEATGGFEAVVAAGLAGAGLPVVVVNPAQVRAFAQALGKRAKTDLIDAAVIAHFAEATKPKAAANAGRGDKTSRRSGRSPAPNRSPSR
jgi:transposase